MQKPQHCRASLEFGFTHETIELLLRAHWGTLRRMVNFSRRLSSVSHYSSVAYLPTFLLRWSRRSSFPQQSYCFFSGTQFRGRLCQVKLDFVDVTGGGAHNIAQSLRGPWNQVYATWKPSSPLRLILVIPLLVASTVLAPANRNKESLYTWCCVRSWWCKEGEPQKEEQ